MLMWTRRSAGRSVALGLRYSVLAVCILAMGCASSSGRRSSADGDITRAELDEIAATDALEAVQQLRPRWFRARAARTPGNMTPRVGVVIDGNPRGDLNDLAMVPLRSSSTATPGAT